MNWGAEKTESTQDLDTIFGENFISSNDRDFVIQSGCNYKTITGIIALLMDVKVEFEKLM